MKNFFTFLFLVSFTAISFAQFSEDFEGDLSTWTVDPAWVQGDANAISSQYFNPPAHTTFISVNDDAPGPGVDLAGYAISPAFMMPDAETILLTFEYYFIDGDYGADETAKVYVSTDGGASLIEVADLAGTNGNWGMGQVNLAEYAGLEIHIAFGYDDGTGWNYGFCVDDVDVDEAIIPDFGAAALDGITTCFESTYVGNEVGGLILVSNPGLNNINSLELAVTVDGTTANETVTGLDIAALGGTGTVQLTSPILVGSGTTNVSVEILSINGETDPDASDNTVEFSVSGNEFATDRGVFVEEATGTWCGWCPRGAVYMDILKECYGDHFVGIAVHNGDPMAVSAYDSGIGNYISGYPSSVFERDQTPDPSQLIAPVEARAAVATPVKLRAGATYDSGTGAFQVSVEAHANSAMDGNYRFLVVVSEDGVTGTASGYNQVNYYSGSGSAWPLDWYSAQGSTVPAADMVYNEVGRALIGGFDGEATTISGLGTGQIFTHHFAEVTMPTAIQNYDNVVINMVLFDGSGSVVNAWKQTFNETLEYVLSDENVILNVGDVRVSPNPTAEDATLFLALEETADIAVDVVDVNGKVVSTTILRNQTGAVNVPILTTDLSNGLYFVSAKVGNTIVTKRLVVAK